MNLTGKQIIAITSAIVSVLLVSTVQLTDIFGTKAAHTIISVAGLVNMVLSSVTAVISSQSALVKDVAAMPGVEGIRVNATANQSLATVATDPNQPKVGPIPGDRAQLEQTAKGG
jgi:hypothetical protein